MRAVKWQFHPIDWQDILATSGMRTPVAMPRYSRQAQPGVPVLDPPAGLTSRIH
jgi:hypothetical protein